MYTDEQETHSLQAVYRFAQYWDKLQSRHWNRSARGDCTFRATMEYQSRRGTIRQFVTVKLGFADPDQAGTVSLSEEGSLSFLRHVLDFLPRRNEYRFTPKRELVISGWSPKVLGQYHVFLLPLANPASPDDAA